tara:strand:- start:40 stop:507 length:468 start_codon:yes stop_codon:yes gene_type:complete
METKIIDNWLDKDLIEFLHPWFLYNSPHFFSQKSSEKDENLFYISNLNLNDPLSMFLNYKLQKTLNIQCYCDDLYVNIQHPDMEGSYHTDNCDITCLLMVSDTLEDCGHFDLKDEKMINFVKNRLIIFDSKKLHRGLAPIKGVRMSLAFKMILKK